MQKQESQCRKIEGYALTLILNPQKLIVRATHNETSDLYVTEFRRGQLPNDIKSYYQTEEMFFDVLLAEEGVRVDEGRLFLPYTNIILNRPVKREFVLPLTKVEANQIEVLKKSVTALKVENQKIPQLEEALLKHMRMLENLERRACIYHYNPGTFRQLALNVENNQLYKIHGNYLQRKPQLKPQNQNSFLSEGIKDMLTFGLISNEPIGQDVRHFSFRITVIDSLSPKFSVFIGLCTKKPEGVQFASNPNKTKFQFIVPKGANQALEKERFIEKDTKESLCKIYYQCQNAPLQKGDTFVLTVDLDNCHLTWYWNEISIERSYFENPLTNIYPFVFLSPSVEVSF